MDQMAHEKPLDRADARTDPDELANPVVELVVYMLHAAGAGSRLNDRHFTRLNRWIGRWRVRLVNTNCVRARVLRV